MSAVLLIAALIAGKVGLAALTAADWAILAQAGFTAARIVVLVGAKIEKDVAAHRRLPSAAEGGYAVRFQVNGGPLGWGRSPSAL